MGWVIKRPNGTYRAWNRNAKDDVLQPGEVWEEFDVSPIISVERIDINMDLKNKIDLALADETINKYLRDILIEWKKLLNNA